MTQTDIRRPVPSGRFAPDKHTQFGAALKKFCTELFPRRGAARVFILPM